MLDEKTRVNYQTIARLERIVTRLAENIALYQQVFRIIEQDREELCQNRNDICQSQENINRILAYLENPNRGDTTSTRGMRSQ